MFFCRARVARYEKRPARLRYVGRNGRASMPPLAEGRQHQQHGIGAVGIAPKQSQEAA